MNVNNLIQTLGLTKVDKILTKSKSGMTLVVDNPIGEKYVVKISEKENHEKKYREFEYLKMISASGINCLQPLGVNSFDGDTAVMYSYIKGELLSKTIGTYDIKKIYTLGSRAGMFLKSIHSCIKPAQNDSINLIEVKDKIIKEYFESNCHLSKETEDKVLSYVNDFSLEFNRNNVFCHGNYRIKNMINTPNGDISILHFDDFYIGDPYSDFSKLIFQNRKNTTFSNGIINGYFNNNVPNDFFKYYYYYGCLELLKTSDCDDCRDRNLAANELIYNSNSFSLDYPKWFKN